MKIGITNILYLAFRLAPFIIVSYFTLQSLLNWNLKGIVYLIGLIFACLLSVIFGKSGFITQDVSELLPDPKCNIITLGEGGPLTNIPLSVTIFSYTFFYLLIFILNLANTKSPNGILDNKGMTQSNINMVMQQNIPTMVIFPLLIILEIMWILSNQCIVESNAFISLLASIVIGGGTGILWSIIITSLNKPELQYINTPGLEVCNRPSKTLYKCRPKNNNDV